MADMQPGRHHSQGHFLDLNALQVFQRPLVALLIQNLSPKSNVLLYAQHLASITQHFLNAFSNIL